MNHQAGKLVMSLDIFKYGTSHEYEGDNGHVLVMTPFIGHDSVSDKVAAGVFIETEDEWNVQGIRCSPIEGLAAFRLLEQASFCFIDGEELGISAADGGEVRGSIGDVVSYLSAAHGKPPLSGEDIQEMYDKLPSERLRLVLMQEASPAGTLAEPEPTRRQPSRTSNFGDDFATPSC